MKIQLAPEVFAPPISDTLLITFMRYVLDGRHRVDIDASDTLVADWLQKQSPGIREEAALAIDVSVKAEAREPSYTTVIVGRFSVSNFSATPATVRLQDARAFLDRPMALLLEDATSDRAFLLKMLTSQERDFIQKQIDEGFVRVDHGGGLDPMRARILDECQDPRCFHTRWVLFDSDALQPGKPSLKSEALHIACGQIPHYQLKRRFIESYLTPRALNVWAREGQRQSVRRRFAVLRAFLRMRSEQKHHFNMKSGFDGDAKRSDESAGNLYDDVNPNDQVTLKQGFGNSIKKLFTGPAVTESDLRRDSGWQEMRPVVQQLLARLR